jgi:hypothetical protein
MPERNFNEDKLYADVLGFSDTVTTSYQLYHLTAEGTGQKVLEEAIQGLPTGSNTAIYYAVDRGLDRIQAIYNNTPPNPLSGSPSTSYYTKYYIVLFTDGMDNISAQLARNNDRGKFANTAEYAADIQKRMSTIFDTKFMGLFSRKTKRLNTFEIYLLGLRGQDLEDSGYSNEDLVKSLRPLMGSYNSITHEPIVSDDMSTLYDDFRRNFTASGFNFFVPKGYIENGYKIKMELGSAEDGEDPCWFVAEIVKQKASGFNALLALFGQRKKEKYVLKITDLSPGLSCENRLIDEQPGTSESSLTVGFLMNNLRFNNAPLTVMGSSQYYDDGGRGTDGQILWRQNREYDDYVGQNRNAYVLLVMDRSGSLNDRDKAASEAMAINIVNLVGQVGADSMEVDTGSMEAGADSIEIGTDSIETSDWTE